MIIVKGMLKEEKVYAKWKIRKNNVDCTMDGTIFERKCFKFKGYNWNEILLRNEMHQFDMFILSNEEK
jgi:hypothetical protein